MEGVPDKVGASLARSLRAHRAARGLSLGDLARASGLSKTSISTIEAGNGNPSLETLWRLSRALDVALGELLGEGEPPPARLIRRGQGTPVESPSGLTARLLVSEGRSRRSEVLEVEIAPGSEHRSEPHLPGTEELVVCVHGSLRVGPAGAEETLGPGDALWFPADVPHAYLSASGAGGYVLMSYPPAPGIEA